MSVLKEYLEAVRRRKPVLVGTGQVNMASLLTLQDDDVPRLIKMISVCVVAMDLELENATTDQEAAVLQGALSELDREATAGVRGRIGHHVPDGWFRTRPQAKQAFQWVGQPASELPAWTDGKIAFSEDGLEILTMEGKLAAKRWDWIVRGLKGEVYPCASDIFKESYEPA